MARGFADVEEDVADGGRIGVEGDDPHLRATAYAPELCRLRTPQGDIQAPVFASNPLSPCYFAELPLAETAAIISAASGRLGTNREYLEQAAAQLLTLDLKDDYLADLVRHVQRSDPDHAGRSATAGSARLV